MFDVLFYTGFFDMSLLVLLTIAMYIEKKSNGNKLIKNIVLHFSNLVGWVIVFKIIVAVVIFIFIEKRIETVFLLTLVIVCYASPLSLFFPAQFENLMVLERRISERLKFQWKKK